MHSTSLMGRTLLLALFCLLALGRLPIFAQSEEPTTPTEHLIWQLPETLTLTDAAQEPLFAPGELLVGFHRDVVRSASFLNELAVEVADPLDLRGLDGENGDAGVEGYLLRVPAGQELATLQALQQDPAVAFVQPNWLVFAADTQATTAVAQPEKAFSVNDPHYGDRQWYLPRINASRAWALATATEGFGGGFSTIHVAVIDSGIDLDHPEFKGRLLDGKNYAVPNSKIVDDCGHGTHVAGLIGAITNNQVGVAGVAPNVRIDPRKVLRNDGGLCVGTVRNVATAIQDVVDSGVDIINLSLQLSTCSAGSECDLFMKTALQRAAANGILSIAASGNSGGVVAYPAAFPDVMGIAATTIDDRRASYSNSGAQVEMAAPGGTTSSSIYSTWPANVNCRSTGSASPQSTYCNSEGTSMSAAIVTGAAALLWSVNPDQTAEDIRQLLRDTATPVNATVAEVGSGRLDLHAALRRLLPSNLQPAHDNLTQTVVSGTLPYTVTIGLDNPSLRVISWTVALASSGNWLRLAGTPNLTATGVAQYGVPGHLALVISPTHLAVGVYHGALEFTATRSNGAAVRQLVNVQLTVGLQPRSWLPAIIRRSTGVGAAPTYRWETPASGSERTLISMTDESEVNVTLPFTFTLRNRAYTDLRLYSNGFVSFPGSETATPLPNQCMPNQANPQQAIYGWWANLDPGAAGARISTFQPGSDRFVIEFDNVPTASGVLPAYRVAFQMVLYTTGNVALNYGQTPAALAGVFPVTVGVEARSGFFYNQVACMDSTQEFGLRPSAPQSLLFNGQEDFY
jgi:subtilisin family serine protease